MRAWGLVGRITAQLAAYISLRGVILTCKIPIPIVYPKVSSTRILYVNVKLPSKFTFSNKDRLVKSVYNHWSMIADRMISLEQYIGTALTALRRAGKASQRHEKRYETLPVFCRPRQIVYRGREKELELIFQLLASDCIAYGGYIEIHRDTNIPQSTLSKWKSRLQDNINWRPWLMRNRAKRALTEEQEQNVYNKLRDDYFNTGKYCPPSVLRTLALEEVAVSEWKEDSDDGKTEFKASPGWMKRYMSRHTLSWHKPHDQRRPTVTDASVARFLEHIDIVFQQFNAAYIVNADETCWRVIDHGRRTMAPIGSATVNVAMRCQKVDYRNLRLFSGRRQAADMDYSPW